MDFHDKCTVGAFSFAILVIFSRSFVHGADEVKTNAEYDPFKILKYGEPLTLECTPTNSSPDVVIKWFKNEKPLTTGSEEKPNVVVKAGTVTINRAMPDDVANYTCLLYNTKSKTNLTSARFEVIGLPYVKLPETITVIEEEKLKLECTVLGSHTPTVSWTMGNDTYKESKDRVKLSTPDPTKGVLNYLFEMEPAKMSDRGNISCSAENLGTSLLSGKQPAHEAVIHEAVIYVRVKDKYAALWPFLGICAEVIVLCTVIFIYEKKRNKSELEESDTDQSPEQKNTPDHGKESVRQRK